MRTSLIFWTTLALLPALLACKPPRSPRERATSSVTGMWTAESVPPGAAGDTGRVGWRLQLQERAAGKVAGRGSLADSRAPAEFSLFGVRGENEITLYFDLAGERLKYHGGIHDPKTMVGELYLTGDTIPVTFTRR